MQVFKNALQLYSDTLSIREQRSKLIAGNIANVSTPQIKARDISFEDAVQRAMEVDKPVLKTHSKHFDLEDNQHEVGYRQPVQASEDGNTVEMSVEQMQFSENVTRYQISLSLLNKKINGLMTAIKGE
ncbi:MAG: flagellar basal body rod protein FlgB [Rhodospirillaceae bacterium]